jgi:hypothetical protein
MPDGTIPVFLMAKPTCLKNMVNMSCVGVIQPTARQLSLVQLVTLPHSIYQMTTEQQCQHTVRITVGDDTEGPYAWWH